MGCTSSEPEDIKRLKVISKDISKHSLDKANIDSRVAKVLLLGAGESGKSTVLKNIQLLYGEGFDKETREACLIAVRQGMVKTITEIFDGSERIADELKDDGLRLSEDMRVVGKRVIDFA